MLVEKFKTISLVNGYNTDLGGHAYNRLRFLDEVTEFPCVCAVAGPETLVHQGGGTKDRFLNINITVYVNDEDSVLTLEGLLEDLEKIIDDNGRLAYLGPPDQPHTDYTRDILITFIDTDQGALAPIGVGEMTLQVKY